MSKTKFTLYLLVFSLCLLASTSSMASQPNGSLSKAQVESLTESISQALKKDYIFPNVASKVAAVLKSNVESSVYDKYQDPLALSERLTKDIRSINNDNHLNVVYTPQSGGMRMVMRGGPNAAASPKMLKRLARSNFGFDSIDILEGNIGYINLTSFVSPTYAGDTASAAMQYLYNTDAIIFDLRENRGGSGEMYQLLASYLFNEGPLLLNEIYWPGENRRYQTWTLPHLPGKRMPNKDIYILTSSHTASAAEVFSYTLKHHNRATVIGEVTIGVANPISPTKINNEFTVWMSKAESKHPITQTNWEGKGVIPHVQTTKSNALNTAHKLALEKLISANKNDNAYYRWYADFVNNKGKTITISSKLLSSYEGTFVTNTGEKRVLKAKNGTLWYGPNVSELTKLKALNKTAFIIPGDSEFKLEINIQNDKVQGISRLFSSGRVISMEKS